MSRIGEFAKFKVRPKVGHVENACNTIDANWTLLGANLAMAGAGRWAENRQRPPPAPPSPPPSKRGWG